MGANKPPKAPPTFTRISISLPWGTQTQTTAKRTLQPILAARGSKMTFSKVRSTPNNPIVDYILVTVTLKDPTESYEILKIRMKDLFSAATDIHVEPAPEHD